MGVIYSKVSDYVFGDYDFEYYNNIESKQQEVKSADNENSVEDKLSHPVSLNEDTLHLLRFLADHGVDVKHTTRLIEQLYARHRRMQYHYLIDVLTNQTQLYEPFQKTKVTVETLMRQRFMAVDKKKDYNQECTQHTFDSNISTIIGIVAKAAAGDLGQIFVALLGDIQKAKLFEKKCKTTGWNDGQLGIIDVQWNDTNNGIILFEIAKISIKLINKSKKALSMGGELEKVEIDAMYMSASAELKKLFPDDEERSNIVKIMKSSVKD